MSIHNVIVKLPKGNDGLYACPFYDDWYYTCTAIDIEQLPESDEWFSEQPCWKKGCPLIDSDYIVVKLQR